MAAPSTVYQAYKTRRRKAGTPDVDIDLYIAKFLQNTTPPSGDDWGDGYFNAADIPPTAADWSAANAKIKAIFKVDGFLCVPKGTTENGFIGFCYSRTAGNGLYHNWDNNTSPFVARGSGVRVPTTAQASAELLNDGGLNSKPHTCEPSSAICLWANYSILQILYRSAYYGANSAMGYTINGVGTKNITPLAPKRKELVTSYPVLDTGVTAGNTFSLEAFITNDEGTTNGVGTYTALEKIWYAGGAGQSTGNGTVWKLPSKDYPLNDSLLYNMGSVPNVSGSYPQIYFRLSQFVALDNLPVQTPPQTPTDIIYGYKTNQLHLGTGNTVESGWYYIANTTETGIPVYGNIAGTSGKVFYADGTGQYLYYAARTVAVPYVRVSVSLISANTVRVAAAMYIMLNGTETVYTNKFANSIIIGCQLQWYISSTGSAIETGTTFNPETSSLTIASGASASGYFDSTFVPEDFIPSSAWIGINQTSLSPASDGTNYTVIYPRIQYTKP